MVCAGTITLGHATDHEETHVCVRALFPSLPSLLLLCVAIPRMNQHTLTLVSLLYVIFLTMQFFRKHRVPSIDEVLKAALVDGIGLAEVEDMMRLRGEHRPPPNFGCFPYPKFTDQTGEQVR